MNFHQTDDFRVEFTVHECEIMQKGTLTSFSHTTHLFCASRTITDVTN